MDELELFADQPLTDWMDGVRRQMGQQANLGAATLDEMYRLRLPVLRPQDASVHLEGESVRFDVPFDGWEHLFRCTPTQWAAVRPRAVLMPGTLRISVSRHRAEEEFDALVSQIQEYLNWLRPQCDEWNAKLPGLIAAVIAQDHERQQTEEDEKTRITDALKKRYGRD